MTGILRMIFLKISRAASIQNTKLNFRNVTNTEIVKDNIITVWLIIVAILKL